MEWINSFPADRPNKRYLLSLSNIFSAVVSSGGNRPEISIPVETVSWDSVRDWSRRETRNALMIRPRLLPRRSAHLHWILWRKRLWLYCAVSEAVPLRLVCATRKNLSLSSPRCCCGTKMPKTHSYGSRKASVTAASDSSLRKLKASPSVTS